MPLKDKYLKQILSGDIIPDQSKKSDGEGLYADFRKLKFCYGIYFRYDFEFNKVRQTITFGKYPTIRLTEARERLREAKVNISKGINPAKEKRKSKKIEKGGIVFKSIAETWLESKDGSVENKKMIARHLTRDIYPVIGEMLIDEVKTAHVSIIVKSVVARGFFNSAKRVGRWIYKIYLYARTVGITENNPADLDFNLLIPAYIPKTFPALIEIDDFKELLQRIENYTGSRKVKNMLRLAVLTMKRPYNLVSVEWSEIDFDNALWTIPASKLKNRRHIKNANRQEDSLETPLSFQALAIFRELLKERADGANYVFPNRRNPARHMVRNTPLSAIKSMGYTNSEMSTHGFRAIARTLIEEQLNIPEKIIEIQLGHSVKSHGGAYDRTKHIDARRDMMQRWSDYVGELRKDGSG